MAYFMPPVGKEQKQRCTLQIAGIEATGGVLERETRLSLEEMYLLNVPNLELSSLVRL